MPELIKNYDFKTSEESLQRLWENEGLYQWIPKDSRDNTFVVDTPPPTVSGQLHMGHIFSYAHADFIVRYKRMRGMNIFYPMGFDDNGLPTERFVEKQRGIKASSMQRSAFVGICNEVAAEERGKFREFFRRIGLSVDWSLEYSTISPRSRLISQMSFLDLVSKNQIYLSDQPMIWDVIDKTALAQAEVEEKERESWMNYITFTSEDSEVMIIATTRPELLPACVAIFCNPSDDRYKHLIGKYAVSPLFDVHVPIIADDMVLQEKGTGLVMCCTFGDNTDILWWKKYNLPLKSIIGKDGKITPFHMQYSEQIEGLNVSDARKKILELLDDAGFLVKREAVTQVVKCAERSGAPLEILATKQWFVKTLEHKDELLRRSEELNWYPKSMKIRLDNWIKSLSWDWCISRQRFSGVPLPVWYSKRPGEEGRPIFASIDQLPVDPMEDLPKGYTREEVEPDCDVMDTWATSAVSPQLSSLGINNDMSLDLDRHNSLFPGDLRPQAHEIIRVWAFYTILKAHLHQDVLPWKNIMISGWCLAEDRAKMSKSKGNAASPAKLLDLYGADAIRYWAASAKLGADTVYSEDVVKNGKRLINKLWNATKFVQCHLQNLRDDAKVICTMDRWLISRLHQVIVSSTDAFEKFEYSVAMESIEGFFWKDFCDNYLEISKARAYNEDGDQDEYQQSAILTLKITLVAILKLFAPFIPHITEEIYRNVFSDNGSLHTKNMWPSAEEYELNLDALSQGFEVIEILNIVRKSKAERNLSIKASIEQLECSTQSNLSNDIVHDLKNVTSSKLVSWRIVEDSQLEVKISYGESQIS